MENSNKNEGLHKLMEKYDFDSPIEVTLVIDEPDPFSLKGLLLTKETNIPSNNVSTNISEVYKKVSNINNTQNKIPNPKKICTSKSVMKENNQSFSINEITSPKEIQEETQDIRCRLLDFIADNLINITKCYYYNFTYNQKQLGNDNKLQSEYFNFKLHFFNLSYSTTINVLLPQEYNIPYLHNFIQRVIKIANHRSWYQISFNKLEILVREMLTWTKQKKHYLEFKFGSHNHDRSGIDCSSTAFTIDNSVNRSVHILKRPLDNGSCINHSRQRINSQSDILPPSLTTYPPVQRINTSPNVTNTTNYLTQAMISPLNINPVTNDLPQDIVNSSNSHYIINNFVHERADSHNVCRENFHSQQGVNISPYFTQRPNCCNQQISAPFNINHRTNNPTEGISRSKINQSTETISLTSNIQCKINNSSNYQAIHKIRNNKEIFLSTGPPNQKITISVDPAILANINQLNNNNRTECHENEAYGTESTKRRKSDDGHYNVTNYFYQESNCSATTFKSNGDNQRRDDSRKAEYERFNTDILRSSISRDSGCGGSPIYGSFRNEEMIEPLHTEEQVTPVISHVTSMHPNAVNLKSGLCTICGATTNNMCIGCYKTYYCSSLCQIKDWDIHKYLCSR